MELIHGDTIEKRIIFYLWIAGIVCLPFDSFPGIFPAAYRPLSIIFFMILSIYYFVQIIYKKNIERSVLILLVFFIYSSIFSLIFSTFIYKNFSGTVDFLVTCIIGVATFAVNNYFFHYLSKYFNDTTLYVTFFFKLISNVYIFVMIIGIIEVLSLSGILPNNIRLYMHYIFSGNLRADRIQLTSSEPSWASMQLLFIIPSFYYMCSVNKKYRKWLYIAIILFLFTFSLQGIVTVMIAVILYNFIKNRKNLMKFIPKILLAIVGCILVLFLLYEFAINLTNSNSYYISRLRNFGTKPSSVYEFLLRDGSTYIRVIFPYIGFLLFLKNPLLGIGAGNYRFEFQNFIFNRFKEGLNLNEIVANINALSANPKNLYTRILGETGIIGFVIFFIFCYLVISKFAKAKFKNKNVVMLWICLLFSFFLQFDSFAYVNFWISMAFINNIKEFGGTNSE